MFTRTLLTTVAAAALAVPAVMANESSIPTEQPALATEQRLAQAGQQTEQAAEELEQEAERVGEEVQQEAGQAAEQVEEETEQAVDDAQAQPDAQPPAAVVESEVADEAMEQEMAEEAEPTPPAEMKFLEVQEETQFLADEEVIGKDVVNVMDEKVGSIADLVMDQDQKLVGVVLSVGGFLGIGDKWVAVAVDQIDFPGDEQPARLLVAVTEEQLKNAPDFVTKDVIASQEAAEQAQQQMQQQMPPPAAAQ